MKYHRLLKNNCHILPPPPQFSLLMYLLIKGEWRHRWIQVEQFLTQESLHAQGQTVHISCHWACHRDDCKKKREKDNWKWWRKKQFDSVAVIGMEKELTWDNWELTSNHQSYWSHASTLMHHYWCGKVAIKLFSILGFQTTATQTHPSICPSMSHNMELILVYFTWYSKITEIILLMKRKICLSNNLV